MQDQWVVEMRMVGEDHPVCKDSAATVLCRQCF